MNEHKPMCKKRMSCAVIHLDGVCPWVTECDCNVSPTKPDQPENEYDQMKESADAVYPTWAKNVDESLLSQPEEWEKSFDNHFKGYWRGHAISDEIKFFIHGVTKKEYKRGRKEGYQAGTVDQMDTCNFLKKGIRTDTLNEVEKIVESMRVILYSENAFQHNRDISRENTLNELLRRIQELKDSK